MEEQRYLISDAAKIVEVEAHVLRYWEEELDLAIGRTELGHRYYTRENIEAFQKVKELKEKGLQLKAIKMVLKELEKKKAEKGTDGEETGKSETENTGAETEGAEAEGAGAEKEKVGGDGMNQTSSQLAILQNTEKLKRFEALVEEIVDRVVRENNEALEDRLESAFSREMDYLLHMQEQQEEERFRRLDEAIRLHQKAGQQVAAAKEKGFFHRWKKMR